MKKELTQKDETFMQSIFVRLSLCLPSEDKKWLKGLCCGYLIGKGISTIENVYNDFEELWREYKEEELPIDWDSLDLNNIPT